MVAKRRQKQAKSGGISVFEKMVSENPWLLTQRVSLGWIIWTSFALTSPMVFSTVRTSRFFGLLGFVGVVITTFILVHFWNAAAAPIIKMLDASKRVVKDSMPKGLSRKGLTTDGVRRKLRELPSEELDRLYTVIETEPQLLICKELCRKSLVLFVSQVGLWSISILSLALTDGWAGGLFAAVTLFGSAVCGIKAIRCDDLEMIGEKLTKARDAVTSRDSIGIDGAFVLGFDLIGSIRKTLPSLNRMRNPKGSKFMFVWSISMCISALFSLFGRGPLSIVACIVMGLIGTFYGYQMMTKGLVRLAKLPRVDSKYRDFARMAEGSGSRPLTEFAFDLRRSVQALKGAGRVSQRCMELILAGIMFNIPLWFAAGEGVETLLTLKVIISFTLVAVLGFFIAENYYARVSDRVEDVSARLERIEVVYGYINIDRNDTNFIRQSTITTPINL